MSKLEKLIQQYCPDGVEFKTIGEVCVVLTGGEAPDDAIKGKEPFGDCIYPIYSNGVGENALWGYASSYKIEKVSVTFSSIGTIGYPTIRKGYYTPIIRLKVIYPQDDSQLSVYYLKYALETVEFEKQKSSVPNINANIIKAISIPVPPLPVQEEIVRVLDAFTELQAELQAELQKRKEQHKYYREGLLTSFVSTQNINKYKLGDICELGTGSHNTQDGLKEGAFPFYTRGVDILWLSTYDFDETAIITAGDGVGVGKVFHYVKGKYALHQRAYRIVPNQKIVLPRYLYYYFETEFYAYIMRSSVSSSVTSIRKPMLLDFPVILPSLSDQQKIVDILDRFDTLTNDLTSGLPAEMEKRRQQYEFYRDKLLTFKRKEA